MPKTFRTLTSVLLCVAASTVSVQAEKVFSGYVCSLQVHRLVSDITWYKNLSRAEEAAKAQSKLILWVHMVGKIDGAT